MKFPEVVNLIIYAVFLPSLVPTILNLILNLILNKKFKNELHFKSLRESVELSVSFARSSFAKKRNSFKSPYSTRKVQKFSEVDCQMTEIKNKNKTEMVKFLNVN